MFYKVFINSSADKNLKIKRQKEPINEKFFEKIKNIKTRKLKNKKPLLKTKH